MKIKRQLSFDTDNAREKLANELLESCPTRSITQLVAVALDLLNEKFELAGRDEKEIKTFITFYDYIKKDDSLQLPKVNEVKERVVKEKAKVSELQPRSSLTTQSDKDKMSAIMNGIFSTS